MKAAARSARWHRSFANKTHSKPPVAEATGGYFALPTNSDLAASFHHLMSFRPWCSAQRITNSNAYRWQAYLNECHRYGNPFPYEGVTDSSTSGYRPPLRMTQKWGRHNVYRIYLSLRTSAHAGVTIRSPMMTLRIRWLRSICCYAGNDRQETARETGISQICTPER